MGGTEEHVKGDLQCCADPPRRVFADRALTVDNAGEKRLRDTGLYRHPFPRAALGGDRRA